MKLKNCEVCTSADAKYVCPRCECRTCCLQCNIIHKKELECNGERDKTGYVNLKNTNTNLVLLSDYRLLEDVTRKTEIFHKAAKPCNRPRHNMRKVQIAAAARNIKLKFFPPIFKRSGNNSTVFDNKGNIIYWHVDWYFINANNIKLSDSKVSELDKLSSVIGKYLSTSEEKLRKKLEYYQAAGHSGIKLLLRAENEPGNKFYEVNPRDTLRECLKNRTIIEHPIFHVVLAEHKYGFDIIDSDLDEDNDDLNKNENLLGLQSEGER